MNNWLRRISTILLSVVLVGVAFQGLISVQADTLAGDYSLLFKSWKEVLLGVTTVLVAILVYRDGSYKKLVRSRILWLVAAIALVHLIVMLVFNHPVMSEGAGIIIDLRIYLAFALAFILVSQYPEVGRPLVVSSIVAMSVTLIFAFLQVFILPRDFLVLFGYSDETILPYLTVDLNDSYIRISSFLRGPNPLGAYAVIGLAGVLSYGWFKWFKHRSADRRVWWILGVGLVLSLVAVWFSYSRSALVGALVVLVGVVIAVSPTVWARRIMIGSIASGVLLLSLLFVLRDVSFISHVFFHTNEESASVQKSDEGRLETLQSGAEAVVENPLGVGIGTTGSPSLLTDNPHIIENQYLYMAHESGIVGLFLQLGLIGWLLWMFWQSRRKDWLVLAVGLSGVALSVVGLVLPVWADDTVGITWWMLAGVALSGVYWKQKSTKKEQYARQGNQETKRITRIY